MIVLKMKRFESFKIMRLDNKKTPTAILLNIHSGFVKVKQGVLKYGNVWMTVNKCMEWAARTAILLHIFCKKMTPWFDSKGSQKSHQATLIK